MRITLGVVLALALILTLGSGQSLPEPSTFVSAHFTTLSSSNDWTQHAHNAQRTSYTSHVVPLPWRWKWAWNGPDANGAVSAGKFGLPRNSQPITGGGRVYIAAGSRGVFALNNADGSVVWNSMPCNAPVNSTPAYDPDTQSLFVVTTTGTLCKLNAATGQLQAQFVTGFSSDLPLPPAIWNDRVFFAMGNLVYALNKYSMQLIWYYNAASPVHTPPAYSPSRNRVIVVSEDLYVHAINNADGLQAWRVKPTPRTGGNPGDSTDFAEAMYGWPVIAEEHGYVLVRYRLDWGAIWRYPQTTDNAVIRSYLAANPSDQCVFVLDLDDGSVPFIANIGHGGFADGGYVPMGPQMVVKRLPDGKELVYTVIRGGHVNDNRWDSHPGEMVLDSTTVPGLQAGDVRWIDSHNFTNGTIFFPTDEQPHVTVSGDYVLFGHWEAGAAYRILDRSPSRGTFANPITTELAPAIVVSQEDPSCPFSSSHYCSDGLSGSREYPPGFYIYYRQGAVYDAYWSEYASWVVANNTVYFVSTDGAIVALESSNPPPLPSGMIFRVDRATGNVYTAGSFSSSGADLAEYISVSEPVEPGDVVELDPHNPKTYRKSRGPYSPLVVGVIATAPGMVLGAQKPDSRHVLALLGIVPVKATAENGPIHTGDLLTSAAIPGYAMRCDNPHQCEGATIGKALDPLPQGTGIIRVLLMR